MATIVERTNRAGVKSYLARIRRFGQKPVSATFRTRTEARVWVQETESAIRRGGYFDQAEAAKHTLRDAIDRYLKERPHRHLKTGDGRDYQLRWFREKIGYKPLSDVTPAALIECRNLIMAQTNRNGGKVLGATANRYFSALSHLFQTAIEEWQWANSNPCRKIRRSKESRGTGRCLTEEEFDRLTAACRERPNENISVVVMLALSTGMRKGELLYLKWGDVDLKNAAITLRDTKNGYPRRVPVCDPALSMLRNHAKVRRLDCDWVFPGPLSSSTGSPFKFEKAWYALLERAGIEDFRFHDTRHSCASFLAMNGASVRDIAEILGHRTLNMAMRYSHLCEAHTREVLERMNRRMWGV